MQNNFGDKGFLANNNLVLSGKEVLDLGENIILIDLRLPEIRAFKRFNVARCLEIPFTKLNTETLNVGNDQLLVLADSAGIQSVDALETLKRMGYKNVAILAGGFVDWERKGLPIIESKQNQLSGSCMCQLRPRNN